MHLILLFASMISSAEVLPAVYMRLHTRLCGCQGCEVVMLDFDLYFSQARTRVIFLNPGAQRCGSGWQSQAC